MSTNSNYRRLSMVLCSAAVASLSGLALAANPPDAASTTMTGSKSVTTKQAEMADAQSEVNDAAKVIERLEAHPSATGFLQRAHGVFILPHYARAAFGVGGRGGEGVLMVKKDGHWTEPAFYRIGGVSIGAQAGVEGGSLVFVLNNDKAVRSFMQDNNWSLGAEAGLTIASWSDKARATAGKSDVTVISSDTKGLLGTLAVSLTDVNFDADRTGAFYGRAMKVGDVFSGSVAAPSGNVEALRSALSTASGQPMSSMGDQSHKHMASSSR